MVETTSLPPDAQARMEMLERSLRDASGGSAERSATDDSAE